MRSRLIAAALPTIAVISLTATACASGNNGSKPATSKATGAATSSPTPSVDISSIVANGGEPPPPTGAQRVALLAAIKAVDPALVAHPDQAINAARDECAQLYGAGDTSGHTAAWHFHGETHVTVTDAQGQAIDTALQSTICPKPNQ